MSRRHIQQRKRQDETHQFDGQLTDHSSAPSPFGLQRMEAEESQPSLQMKNPKLQLQQAQTTSFSFAPKSGGGMGKGEGASTQQGTLQRDRHAIQSKAMDENQSPLFSGHALSETPSNPTQNPFSKIIQAKKDPAIIQRKVSVQQGLAYIKAGKRFKSISEWKVEDFILYHKHTRGIEITNRTKFDIFAQFVAKEFSDENTNGLLLISSMNDNPKRLLAIAEMVAQNMFISPSDYKFQKYLPQIQYPTDAPPEDINVSGPISTRLKSYYNKLQESMAKVDDDPSSQNINDQVDAHIGLSTAVSEVGSEAIRFLRAAMTRFTTQATYANLFPTAYRLDQMLGMIPGGARKRRILGGYHEAEDQNQ